jgi:hypothetical protein
VVKAELPLRRRPVGRVIAVVVVVIGVAVMVGAYLGLRDFVYGDESGQAPAAVTFELAV